MSVRARYLTVIFSLIVVIVVALTYFVNARLMSAHLASKVAAGNMIASSVFTLAQQTITNNPQKSAQDAIRDDPQVKSWLAANGGFFAYLAIINADQKIIAEHDPQQLRNSANNLPIEKLSNKGWLREWNELRQNRNIYEITTPLNVNNQPFGKFVVGVTAANLLNEIAASLRLSLIVALVTILLSLLTALLLSGVILHPLQEFFGLIDLLERESENQSNEASGQDLQSAAERLRELGRRFAGNRTEVEAMRDQMRQVVNNLPDRMLLLDKEQRVMMSSPQAEALLLNGKLKLNGSGQLRGEILSEVLDETHPVALLITRAFNSGQAREETLTLESADHQPQKLLATVQVFEEQGKLAGAMLTLRDFESLKRLESQLDYATRIAALSRITSGVAHEVKNPLHAMVLHLELLRTKIEAGRDPGNHVEVLTSEVNRLNRVVQTFLDFTRPVTMQTRKHSVKTLLEEVVLLAPVNAEPPIKVVLKNSAADLKIEADLDLLKQGLLNIVINACQAMPDGGTLTISSEQVGNQIEISIADTGAGIPEELKEKIFNLYFTTKSKGSGIGLAQAFRAVQMHGGAIEVESEIGKGTRFRIQLPVA